MDSSSKNCTNCCGSKELSSANIIAHTVYSVARYATMMVEKFCPPQKRDSRGVVNVSVSKVNFKRPTPKKSVAILECQLSVENDACT